MQKHGKWMSAGLVAATWLGMAAGAVGREYHVSPLGDDANDGTAQHMLQTISRAALLARPGDVIIVHEGVYRERINPPRGGDSDERRIVYRAAPGEVVVIRGSEVVKGWEKAEHNAWKVTLPDGFFGSFNPFADEIHGDWFNPKGRVHHTGAVYLNGHWLTEAATLDEVLAPAGDEPLWYVDAGNNEYLLNVEWIRLGDGEEETEPIPAARFAQQRGTQVAPTSDGGECVGWIEDGDWVRYDSIDFGDGVQNIGIRAASVTGGGKIEFRLDGPDGDLLGICTVEDTGGWQSWRAFSASIKPTRGVQNLCLVFKPHRSAPIDTTIWAQFKDINPNEADVEINVRQSVFYPDKPGVNYITVSGFTMMHAATPWAPPTAEQIGLIGTHWSKGWIIENNDISYSTCTGITLGKYGDEWDNRSQSADAYNKTIERALENGWNKDTIGGHIVRNNEIAHCEQAGIVGSLGAVFSSITGNTIHDIHVRQLFTGAEMAGIKIHASIDMEISGNHIFRTCRGIWLDWMAQGTRVSGNLLHDNNTSEDLFVEVNHGPFLVDNNIFLSPSNLMDWSEGGAYVHNLFAGRITLRPELSRETPYHKAHSTEVAGLRNIAGGDDRFYNNLFVGSTGLTTYDNAAQPVWMEGNVFVNGATPSKHERQPLVAADFDAALKLNETTDGMNLDIMLDSAWLDATGRGLVTTTLLGFAATPNLKYKQHDGGEIRIDIDYAGNKRNEDNPFPGPFEMLNSDRRSRAVWPTDR